MRMKAPICSNKGFTLVELMTSLAVFMVIMTIAMGSVLGIFSANRKAQAESAMMNNLNLAMESMAREMRFGQNYHCGTGTYTTAQSCPSGDTVVSFLSSDGRQMVYRLSGSAIERSSDGGANFVGLTAPEIVIENLKFYVLGATPTPDGTQPKVVITLKGYSGERDTERTDFSLQTVVSQRLLDNGL
jgi:prepilin-type N-terminal cleavage/methylation domain-containing protein